MSERRERDDEHTEFVYGGQADWQLLEEYDARNQNPATSLPELLARYAYGNYIDKILQAERDTTAGSV